ncbi:hypothetical protein PR202_ga19186 [Eleusine coracana subsp. coracana]|uniref:F-box protein n=1 Tax=Eleusine coracana subsp. coracana TaxID=191504 RepID=A0AAV5CTZ2_ELECO|nr:hypothetical protein PR202_ga19186 [Eleusine coracana subsp. coracana]
MEKAAGEDENVEERGTAAPSSGGPAAKKKKKRAAASGAGRCDDVFPNIFARLPARSAVASMALSKHHRAMICSPEFRTLHCRLGAPLPQPHIAYVATAEIRRRPERDPVIGYHGFHVTGGGGGGGLRSNEDPMRVLCGGRYLETSYANTCDGILVLGNKEFSSRCRCILWNPAVADVAEEVTIFPGLSPNKEHVVFGMGCGRKSKTYKVLMCRENATTRSSFSYNYNNWSGKEGGYKVKSRADYALLMSDVHGQEEARLLTVLSTPRNQENEEINLKSLYMDGTFYLLHLYEPVILAVDMDDETVNTILLPGEHLQGRPQLLDMSSRLCVVGIDGHRRTVWLITTGSGDASLRRSATPLPRMSFTVPQS